MGSDDKDTQPTVREKYKPIDRTWTGHTPLVEPSEISDDEDTADTPQEPRVMGLFIPISPYQDQEYEAYDAKTRQVTFNMDSALYSEYQH